MVISESVEDYLEAILVLQQKNGYVRSVDIAAHLDLSKASVSIAMKNLKNNHYIKISDSHEITLTESGLDIARSVYERHLMFCEFFVDLGVPKEIANRDACKIEHVVSKTTFDAIKKFVALHFDELHQNADAAGGAT